MLNFHHCGSFLLFLLAYVNFLLTHKRSCNHSDRMLCFISQASIILCCLGCAIFGITEVPTDGVQFDTTDYSVDNLEAGAATPPGTNYNPPPEEQTTPQDAPSMDEVNDVLPPPPTQQTSPIVDLLDDQERGAATGAINELD